MSNQSEKQKKAKAEKAARKKAAAEASKAAGQTPNPDTGNSDGLSDDAKALAKALPGTDADVDASDMVLDCPGVIRLAELLKLDGQTVTTDIVCHEAASLIQKIRENHHPKSVFS